MKMLLARVYHIAGVASGFIKPPKNLIVTKGGKENRGRKKRSKSHQQFEWLFHYNWRRAFRRRILGI
uniref:Uncharacterized protein n=1 Tax=Salix viminalis TaxID=40686 RepID=A0A6N2LJ48_SALVM